MWLLHFDKMNLIFPKWPFNSQLKSKSMQVNFANCTLPHETCHQLRKETETCKQGSLQPMILLLFGVLWLPYRSLSSPKQKRQIILSHSSFGSPTEERIWWGIIVLCNIYKYQVLLHSCAQLLHNWSRSEILLCIVMSGLQYVTKCFNSWFLSHTKVTQISPHSNMQSRKKIIYLAGQSTWLQYTYHSRYWVL